MKTEKKNRLVGVPKMRGFKPIIAKHEGLFDLEAESGMPIRFGYMLLWACCDRDGIFRWRPKTLKAEVFPYDELNMENFLNFLWRDGYILKYKNGLETYGFVIKFTEHQSVNGKELASGYPLPFSEESYVIDYINESNSEQRVNNACSTRDVRVNNACSTQVQSEFTEKEVEVEFEVEVEVEVEKESESKKTLCLAKETTDLLVRKKNDDVKKIFEHWKDVMNSPKSKIDVKRRRLINTRLEEGYTVDQLIEAVSGCAKSDYHMGANERRAKYNSLDLILRNADKVDAFIAMHDEPISTLTPLGQSNAKIAYEFLQERRARRGL